MTDFVSRYAIIYPVLKRVSMRLKLALAKDYDIYYEYDINNTN